MDANASSPSAHSILLVDDDEIFRERLARAIRTRGWAVTTAGDANAALAALGRDEIEYALVDLRMPGQDGIDLIRVVLQRHPDVRCVVLTGYGSIATALEAIRAGAHDYLTKPVDADQVLEAFSKEPESSPSEADPSEHAAPSLARVEWEHIQRVLTDCDNNISQAARLLGIHRRSLQRKLSKYPPRR